MLCGTRPPVAEVLRQLGMASRVAMYPSLDQALAKVGGRLPWLRAPGAGASGPRGPSWPGVRPRVCGRWGLEGLADPAALLANELVALAVTRARPPLQLRVELRGSRLHVAVSATTPTCCGS